MSLVATLMQDLRSEYTNTLDKYEQRESKYGALRFFQDEAMNRPILDNETIDNIKMSFNRNVVVPVLNSQTVTVSGGYARTCAITTSENESALVTLTFTTYGWAFTMQPSINSENDIKYQQDFTRKQRKYLIEFASVLDTACVAQLDTDKNQFWTGVAPTYYAEVADALQVPQAEKNDLFNQVDAIMSTMDFYDDNHIVGSTSLNPNVRRSMAQGPNNAVNDQFQFMDPMAYKFWSTNRIANGAGVEATMYSLNAGSVGIWNRNDPDARAGHSISDYKQWSEESMPIVDMTIGAFYQKDCADVSSLAGASSAGLTRSLQEGFEFSTDIVTVTAYNSDPVNRYSPIVKYEVLT